MYREAIFPDDWIPPGAFRFCSACGMRLVDGNEVCCSRGKDEQDRATVAATDSRLRSERLSLATANKDAGLPPLFWMGGDK
jgi:hypothetical protein